MIFLVSRQRAREGWKVRTTPLSPAERRLCWAWGVGGLLALLAPFVWDWLH